jgi:DNA-binding MarR family transcriptional regulator
MSKKDSRQAIKDMIFNQAASTVDDLYAKRNALLIVSEDAPEEPAPTDGLYELTTPPLQVVNLNSSVNLNLPQTSQIKLTSQNQLTQRVVNSISPVNINSPRTSQISLTSQNQLPKETSKFAQTLGLSSVGALMILQKITGNKGSYIRTRNLARELGMTYQGLLNQIERLTSTGYIVSKPGESTLGRWIEITETGQLALTGQLEFGSQKNFTSSDLCSCSKDIKQQLPQSQHEEDQFNLIGQLELTNQVELASQPDLISNNNNGQLNLTNQIKLTNMPPWEKAQLKNQAEELFYIGLVAKIDPESFSLQTLVLYTQIVKEHGRDWSAALFLILLPKAKDNVTGYIFSAYKKGAEPTSGSVIKVKDMWAPLETLTTVKSYKKLKTQILEAAEKEDTELLISLTQTQTRLKTALRLLFWSGSVDSLIEKKYTFFSALGF